MVEISQNFVAFSEYMNFTDHEISEHMNQCNTPVYVQFYATAQPNIHMTRLANVTTFR